MIEAPVIADCVIGNTAKPGYVLSDRVANETPLLGSTFDPNAYGCPCTGGFTVDAYHFVIAKTDTYETDLPHYVLMLGDSDLLGLGSPDKSCHAPSPGWYYTWGSYCGGEAQNLVVLRASGFYEITLELSECGCIMTSYAQTFTFLPPFPPPTNVFLVTDIAASHCADYTGSPGWHRIYWLPFDAPGNIVVWADVSCCENPVPAHDLSWGAVKELYR